MKIIKANNTTKVKISQKDWVKIGKKAGWIKANVSKEAALYGLFETKKEKEDINNKVKSLKAKLLSQKPLVTSYALGRLDGFARTKESVWNAAAKFIINQIKETMAQNPSLNEETALKSILFNPL